VSDAAKARLMTFPPEVRLVALLRGLDGQDDHVRAACAFILLHERDKRVLSAMSRHIHDPDSRVAWRAKFHVERYGGNE